MKIGEIATKAHISPSIIRYYERTGLLPCARRDSSGYREYGEADLMLIQVLSVARHLGCSFAQIKDILTLENGRNDHSADVCKLLEDTAVEVDHEIDRLRTVEQELARLQCFASGHLKS